MNLTQHRLVARLKAKVTALRQRIENREYHYLEQAIAEYVATKPFNPTARLSPNLPVWFHMMGDWEPIGLANVKNKPNLEELRHLRDFTRRGGKLICLPMWPGLPAPEHVPMFSAIGHATPEPPPYLQTVPTINLSATDFLPIQRFFPMRIPKRYDFLIVTWAGSLREKRWDLVMHLIERQCPKYSIIIVAYRGTPTEFEWSVIKRFTDRGTLTFINEWVPKEEFPRLMNECRVQVIPSEWDNHPRIMDQALLCDIPLVVNANIYGGKKLIVDCTGRLVPPEALAGGAEWVLVHLDQFKGLRAYYLQHFGPYNATRHLTAFLNQVFNTEYRAIVHGDRAFMFHPEYISAIPDVGFPADAFMAADKATAMPFQLPFDGR